MSVIDFETSIAEFLALGRKLQALQPLTGAMVWDAITEWYRDVRVEGASEEGDDMLLLQWGEYTHLILPEPMDVRGMKDSETEFSDRSLPCLGFVRQVFTHGVYDLESLGDDYDEEDLECIGEEIEFDDGAVQMSVALYYEQAAVERLSSDFWIEKPEEIDEKRGVFWAEPFVAALIDAPASKVVVTVDACG